MKTAFLLVSCCLEESRTEVLRHTVKALLDNLPSHHVPSLTVFDNASSDPSTIALLKDSFSTVYRSDRNVGYWSAISWWLESLVGRDVDLTYIIESDMIHYDLSSLDHCINVLSEHDDIGSIRMHHYDVENRHLFDKDRPRSDSYRNLWQSHTNKVTSEPIIFSKLTDVVWSTTFLTQLPAINRYVSMKEVFSELRGHQTFSELDFQRLYWKHYNRTGILDGGAFHCDLNAYGSKVITGSWTDVNVLKSVGYQPTRQASIVPADKYTVTLV